MIRFIKYAEGSCRLSGCDLVLLDLLIKYQKIQPNASEILWHLQINLMLSQPR